MPKLICVEVNEIFRNLCRSSCAKVHPCRSSITREILGSCDRASIIEVIRYRLYHIAFSTPNSMVRYDLYRWNYRMNPYFDMTCNRNWHVLAPDDNFRLKYSLVEPMPFHLYLWYWNFDNNHQYITIMPKSSNDLIRYFVI